MGDESIQFSWCMIDVDISDLKNSLQLLCEIVETYVTARSFAMSSAWLNNIKKLKIKMLTRVRFKELCGGQKGLYSNELGLKGCHRSLTKVSRSKRLDLTIEDSSNI